MGLYSQFETDPELEKTGVPIEYGDAARVTIARAGGANKRFAKELELLSRPYRRAIKTETISLEQAEAITRTAYARTIIRNWESKVDGEWKVGIESPDGGELLPVTEENVVSTLKALPEIFAAIKEDAERLAIWLKEVQETESGN